MENQVTSSKPIILNYGLMLGVITILISVANYAFGNAYEPHWSINVISIILMITFIVLGIKKLKESNGGFLKLGQALKVGIGIALIAAILGALYFFVFTKFIEPDFFTKIAQIQEQKWYDAGMAEEQIEASKAMMAKMSGPGITIAFLLIMNLFLGFVVSLIAGLVMKKTEE